MGNKGKQFRGAHVHSIMKRKRVRDKKLKKKYPEVRSDFYLDVYDKSVLFSELKWKKLVHVSKHPLYSLRWNYLANICASSIWDDIISLTNIPIFLLFHKKLIIFFKSLKIIVFLILFAHNLEKLLLIKNKNLKVFPYQKN